MISSCATLGLDYHAVGLGEFLEAVEAYNESSQPDKPEPASDDFRQFMRERFRAG